MDPFVPPLFPAVRYPFSQDTQKPVDILYTSINPHVSKPTHHQVHTYSQYPALLSAVVYVNKHIVSFSRKSFIPHSHKAKPETDGTNLSIQMWWCSTCLPIYHIVCRLFVCLFVVVVVFCCCCCCFWGVDTFRSLLRASKWAFFVCKSFRIPQISEPYNNVGLICVSNNFRRKIIFGEISPNFHQVFSISTMPAFA